MGNKDIKPSVEAVDLMFQSVQLVASDYKCSSDTVFEITFCFKSLFKGLKTHLVHFCALSNVSAFLIKTKKKFEGTFITEAQISGSLSNICKFANLINENDYVRIAFIRVEKFNFFAHFWAADALVVIRRGVSEWRIQNEEEHKQDNTTISSGAPSPFVSSFKWEKTGPRKSFLILCSQWDFYKNDSVLAGYKPIEVVMCELYYGKSAEILEQISTTTENNRSEILEIKTKITKMENEMTKMENDIAQILELLKVSF